MEIFFSGWEITFSAVVGVSVLVALLRLFRRTPHWRDRSLLLQLGSLVKVQYTDQHGPEIRLRRNKTRTAIAAIAPRPSNENTDGAAIPTIGTTDESASNAPKISSSV